MSNKNTNHIWAIEKKIFYAGETSKPVSHGDDTAGLWLPTQHMFTHKTKAQEKLIELFQQGTEDKLRLVMYVAAGE